MPNTDKLKEQIQKIVKELVEKSNSILNEGENKQKVTAYIYIILSLLSLSFFGIFAIGPTISTIVDLNQQYSEGEMALQQLEQKNADLKSLTAQYLKIKPDLNLVTNAIPEKPNIAQLTRQVEVLANQNNLVVTKLNTGLMELYPAKNTTSPVFSYSFSVSVEGQEGDINKFIGEVVNIDRIVSIDRLSTGTQQGNNFTASFTGRAFFYKSQFSN
jgi:Tfp pilus assembly protein PilO